MKERPKAFLADLSHGSEVFDYIVELHEYLWRVVRAVEPGASGHLNQHIDRAIALLEADAKRKLAHTGDRRDLSDGEIYAAISQRNMTDDECIALDAAFASAKGEQK